MYRGIILFWVISISVPAIAEEYPGQFCHLRSGVTPLTADDVASAKAFPGPGNWDEVGGCRVENNRYAKVYLYGRMRGELTPRGGYVLCTRPRLALNAGLRETEQGEGKSIEFLPMNYKSLLRYTYLVWVLPKKANLDCSQVNKMDAILLYYPIEKHTLIRLYRNWKSLLESTDSYRKLHIQNYIDQLRLESIEMSPFSLGGLYVLNLAGTTKGECKRYRLSIATTETGALDPFALNKGYCGSSEAVYKNSKDTDL